MFLDYNKLRQQMGINLVCYKLHTNFQIITSRDDWPIAW